MAVVPKFTCDKDDYDYLIVENLEKYINILGYCNGKRIDLLFDRSTSIKFAKTLRTEINKI
jgi:hypothetical protein